MTFSWCAYLWALLPNQSVNIKVQESQCLLTSVHTSSWSPESLEIRQRQLLTVTTSHSRAFGFCPPLLQVLRELCASGRNETEGNPQGRGATDTASLGSVPNTEAAFGFLQTSPSHSTHSPSVTMSERAQHSPPTMHSPQVVRGSQKRSIYRFLDRKEEKG